ncbi:MAG: M3 family metallopeptidase [Halobacteriovoraceae bacterium]|nr:M3 family metallopeptidase [Halobacteriovoraceae bacterium]MCB9094068.1 M3 family metallopeptidase [Halobacteriovoraceae bacterium]
MKKGIFLALLLISSIVYSKDPKDCKNYIYGRPIDQIREILEESNLRLGAIKYGILTITDLKKYFEVELRIAKNKLKKIIDNPEKPTFENTIIALEDLDKKIGVAFTYVGNYEAVNYTDYTSEVSLKLEKDYQIFSDLINYDEKLFKRVESVYKDRKKLGLDREDIVLIEDYYDGFVRKGVNLPKAKKARLTQIDLTLKELSNNYSKNLLKHRESIVIGFSEEEMDGIPEDIKAIFKEFASKKGMKQPYGTSAVGTTYRQVFEFANKESTRKKVYEATAVVGSMNGFDNTKIVYQIAKLRKEKAKILGFNSYADFILDDRMIGSRKKAITFLNDLHSETKKFKDQDEEELKKFVETLTGKYHEIAPWDNAYYSRLLKKKFYDFDPNDMKPYLEVNKFLGGVFKLVEDFYGVEIKPVELPKFHPDVMTFAIVDSKTRQQVGLYYLDLYSRETKRGGAWMNSLMDQYKVGDKNYRPHVVNVMNVPKPAGSDPTLLTLDEAETLIHELGHGLHSLFSDVKYRSHAGTSVKWDFVEVPSMTFEKFLYVKKFLKSFATHYKTGKEIPDEMIDKLLKAKSFQAGTGLNIQTTYALLDMAWHTDQFESIKDIKKFEDKLFDRTPWEASVAKGLMSLRFSHLFAGGYGAGYYTYMWSEALASDAFEFFEKHGTLSPEIAMRFRNYILSVGGSVDEWEAYRAFRGQDPDMRAIYRVNGLE